jgi:hypothetical protein
MAPSCAYVLTLGKKHYKYAPSTYRVCVTPTQAKALFGTTTKPKTLGCGVFACAFEHKNPDRIVKITRDPSDVAGLLRGQGLPQIPKVYASHQLVGRPYWTAPRQRQHSWQEWPDRPEAYAVVVERLRTFTGVEASIWNKRIQRMRLYQKGIEDQEAHRQTASGQVREQFTIGALATAVCPKRPVSEAKSCQLRIRELNKMSSDLRDRGIEWSDIHAGNIGIDKRGRWKAIDVGASTTPLTTRPAPLAGSRTRKPRRCESAGKR